MSVGMSFAVSLEDNQIFLFKVGCVLSMSAKGYG